MSVLIKGMKKPTDCWLCPMMKRMLCGFNGERVLQDGIRDDCPLVEVEDEGEQIMTNNEAIKWLDNLINDIGHPQHQGLWGYHQALDEIKDIIEQAELQTAYEIGKQDAQIERKLTNKEWVDFLSKQFNISRTSAKEMLHVMMNVKKEDDFKKQYSGGNNEKE